VELAAFLRVVEVLRPRQVALAGLLVVAVAVALAVLEALEVSAASSSNGFKAKEQT
jgi:hypothetical protein